MQPAITINNGQRTNCNQPWPRAISVSLSLSLSAVLENGRLMLVVPDRWVAEDRGSPAFPILPVPPSTNYVHAVFGLLGILCGFSISLSDIRNLELIRLLAPCRILSGGCAIC